MNLLQGNKRRPVVEGRDMVAQEWQVFLDELNSKSMYC